MGLTSVLKSTRCSGVKIRQQTSPAPSTARAEISNRFRRKRTISQFTQIRGTGQVTDPANLFPGFEMYLIIIQRLTVRRLETPPGQNELIVCIRLQLHLQQDRIVVIRITVESLDRPGVLSSPSVID